jgi:hypothetical protein
LWEEEEPISSSSPQSSTSIPALHNTYSQFNKLQNRFVSCLLRPVVSGLVWSGLIEYRQIQSGRVASGMVWYRMVSSWLVESCPVRPGSVSLHNTYLQFNKLHNRVVLGLVGSGQVLSDLLKSRPVGSSREVSGRAGAYPVSSCIFASSYVSHILHRLVVSGRVGARRV